MKFNYDNAFQRNVGIYSLEEQDRLRNAIVAIIGSGGDGGLLAERLIRSGVGEIRLCDPESFSVENLNRQFGSNIDTMGINKATVVASNLKRINPEAKIVSWKEGVSEANISSFVLGADLIIDESEYSYPDIAIMISRVARELRIPIITGANVALGANIFAFSPIGISVEEYYKMKNITLGDARKTKVPISAFCPIVPSYVDFQVFKSVADGKISVPAVSQSVAAVASVVVNESVEYLIGRRNLVYLPKYINIDLHNRSMKVRRVSSFTFYFSLVKIIAKSIFRRG